MRQSWYLEPAVLSATAAALGSEIAAAAGGRQRAQRRAERLITHCRERSILRSVGRREARNTTGGCRGCPVIVSQLPYFQRRLVHIVAGAKHDVNWGHLLCSVDGLQTYRNLFLPNVVPKVNDKCCPVSMPRLQMWVGVRAPSSPPLLPLTSIHSHQTNHAQFSVMWSAEGGGRKRWVLIHHLRRNNSWPKETGGRREEGRRE